MRPIIKGEDGVVRFEANPIVVKLFEETIKVGFALKELKEIRMFFEVGDWEEFLQLIGWPIRSYCTVDLVSKRTAEIVMAKALDLYPDLV